MLTPLRRQYPQSLLLRHLQPTQSTDLPQSQESPRDELTVAGSLIKIDEDGLVWSSPNESLQSRRGRSAGLNRETYRLRSRAPGREGADRESSEQEDSTETLAS